MSARRGIIGFVAGLVIVCGVGPTVGDTIETAGKAIRESAKKVKSLSAAMRTVSEMSGEGYKHKTVVEGRFEMVHKGDKFLTRIESKDSSTTEVGGKPEKREGTTLVVSDGEFTWSYIQANGEKNVYKMKAPAPWDLDPFEQYGKTHALELLPDEKIDGADVYVVRATPKAAGGQPASGKMTLYYRKDCGFAVKIVTADAAGEPKSTMTYSDLKLDAEISPDRFVFKAPEGVKVTDMTQTPAPSGKPGEKPAEAKGEEPKKDTPKKEEEPKKSGPKLPKLPRLP